MVGVDGWEDWHQDSVNTLNSFERERAACEKLAEHNPPNNVDIARIRACRNNAFRKYQIELTRLTNEFIEIAVGKEDVVEKGNADMWRCVRHLF
jgi:hypothetical protein